MHMMRAPPADSHRRVPYRCAAGPPRHESVPVGRWSTPSRCSRRPPLQILRLARVLCARTDIGAGP
eukprot:5761680-Prymnesium_polylepis.2